MQGAATTAFDVLRTGLPGFAIVAAAFVVYYAVKHGVPATLALFKGWYNKAKVDVVALENRVSAIEVSVGLKKPAAPSGPTAGHSGASGPAK